MRWRRRRESLKKLLSRRKLHGHIAAAHDRAMTLERRLLHLFRGQLDVALATWHPLLVCAHVHPTLSNLQRIKECLYLLNRRTERQPAAPHDPRSRLRRWRSRGRRCSSDRRRWCHRLRRSLWGRGRHGARCWNWRRQPSAGVNSNGRNRWGHGCAHRRCYCSAPRAAQPTDPIHSVCLLAEEAARSPDAVGTTWLAASRLSSAAWRGRGRRTPLRIPRRASARRRAPGAACGEHILALEALTPQTSLRFGAQRREQARFVAPLTTA
mmetsp:Transcript_21508/g.43564  ORF Transcript_21508/g.43564 Transcript_21508/m.43564 type:complete len:267 (-) Transcript_21508:72-872(-)